MAITTSIKNYPATHGKNEGGGGGTTIIMGGGSANIPANLNVTSINAERGDISYLEGKSLTYNDAQFIYMAADDGTINKLRGDEIRYNVGRIDDFHADLVTSEKVDTKQLNVDDYAWIKSLQSNNITTEYLTVTKQAHFFELIIDKIRSVGGTLMLTQANCVADYVKAYTSGNTEVILDVDKIKAEHPTWSDQDVQDEIDARLLTVDHFDIFFLGSDNSGRSITNDWVVDDQAICQSFNNVSTGVNYNVSNKYYWRLVTAILADRYMNINTGEEIPLNQSAQATENSVTISNPYLKVANMDSTEATADEGWNTVAQSISGVITGATWTQTSGGAGQQTVGTMTTTNTVFGIQMSPIETEDIADAIPTKFGLTCTAARLNIGIYFTDGSSQFFAAPESAQTTYEYNLSTTATVEAIVITNADEVEWKLVHGISISNVDCDNMLSGYASIPSTGDNIVQLGFRYQNDPTYPTNGTAAQIKAWIESNAGIYDRAAAQIISTYKSPDSDVRPPAYAQYTGINDYNLTNHRGTYIDATGGYFKGKLVTESGTEIDITDQGLAVDVEFYKIVPEYNVISIDTNSQINPSNLVVNFLVSGNSTLSSTVPTNCAFTYSIDGATATSIAAGNTVSINISSMTASSNIVMNLLKNNELVDSITMRVTDIQAAQGAPGKNGQFTQYAYKNAATQPSAPSSSTSTYPPQGWSATPTTPNFANGEYTWCTTRTVSYDASNNVIYGAWQTPYRITGDNGQAGEDGDMTEFIYTRNNGDIDGNPSAPDAPPHGHGPNSDGSYPRDWSGTDYYGTVWTDNPQGVGDPSVSGNYKYEYISSREYNGSTRTWGDYTTPSLWSNYGEKGQDGDGYEYIYHRYDTEITDWSQIIGSDNPQNWTNLSGFQNDDYLGPTGYEWDDEPQGVTSSANEKFEYVSTRKKTNGTWGAFGVPALWAQYVPPGTAGQNGQFTQYAYKNAATQPSAPSTSTATYPPTGWSATPTTPNFANGEYTWCTTRTVTYNSSNQPVYGAWQTPYRLTGDNGQPGEDGKYTEFVYRRFKVNNVPWSIVGDLNPANWDENTGTDRYGHSFQDPDYQGPSYSTSESDSNYWTDNPNGVDSTYKYEYMAVRTFNGTSFDYFETPVVWSTYGEKGQDGDGVEYIFKHYTTEQSSWTGNNNPANWNADQSDQYLGPTGYQWSADPEGVDGTNKYEYYAMRKKKLDTSDNVVKWGKYTAPKLWNQWATSGPQGPQGPQGNPGDTGTDAEYDMLVPVREDFNVQINAQDVGAQKYENITGKVYTYLRYAVAHVKGDNVTYLTRTQLATYKLNVRPYYGNSAVGESGHQSFDRSNASTTTINGTSCGILYFNESNLLSNMWPTYTNRQNYYYLCENNQMSYAPTAINVTLVRTVSSVDTNVDSRTVPLIFKPSNIFSVTDTALNSIYQGLTGNTDAYSATGMSAIKQSWDQISSRVTNIENAGYVNQSQVTQTANQIASQVVAQYSDAGQVAKTVQLDLTSLSTTTFYPVSISLKDTTKPQRIIVSRPLNTAYGSVDYGSGYPSDTRGFSLTLDLETIACGWGANWSANPTTQDDTANKIHYYIGTSQYEPIFVGKYEVGWSREVNNIPKDYIAGNIQQNWCRSLSNNAANDEIIYLRGGSKYDVGCSWSESTITLHSTGYHWESAVQSDGWKHVYDRPVISDWSTLEVAIQDEMKKSEIIQTANNIQLNVYNELLEKTGIDITTGQITLNADNTTINGSLKITNSTDGVVVYNDQNQKAVEVVRDSIGSFGTSQNTTTTYSDYAETYTYIVGNNTYRMYLSTYDTTAGYPRESIREWESTRVGGLMRIGNIAAGTVINFNAGNIIWTIGGVGGNYNQYTGQYAYTNDNIYSSVGNCKVRFRIHALYGDNEWPYDSGWITPSFNTSTKKFSNSSAFSYTVTQGNNNADFALWIDWKGDNPIISDSDRYKIIKFNADATVINTISINTKIGTDGMRTVTPDGLFWTNNERTTIARLANYGIYGANMNYGGFNMDVTGPTKIFGSALTSMHNYDNVGQLLNVNGGNSSTDRRTGYVKYNTSNSIDGAWRNVFCYNMSTNEVMPSYIYFTGVNGSYPNVDPYFTFVYSSGDNLPRGLTVTIINHCGRTLWVAAHYTLPSKMFTRDSSSTTTKIGISNGSTSRFVHLGEGYFKQLNLN